MYKIYSDSNLIYTPLVPDLKVVNPMIKLELNKVGESTFQVFPNHPSFDHLKKLKSIIKIYDDDYVIFRGRIINDIQGFYNEKNITCEGELAFLNDSIQRPYDFTGTPAELFTQFITTHNSQVENEKKFIVGDITVTDPNNYIARSNAAHSNTWEAINDKLIKTHGGYLWVRHEADGNYIDYLLDFSTLNPQAIEFGKNLLDFKRKTNGEDIATAIIPVGAVDEVTGQKISIESVNGGVDYVFNQEAVDTYGWIFKVVEFNDVTVPSNLLTKVNAYLVETINLLVSIDIDALDLPDQASYNIGSYIKVTTSPHGITGQNFLINKLSIDMTNPANNKLTLGTTYSSFIDESLNVKKENGELLEVIEIVTKDMQNYTDDQVGQASLSLINTISQTATATIETVGQKYYSKGETDKLISDTSSTLTHTMEGWTMSFDDLVLAVDDLTTGTSDEFIEIHKYIRFLNGDILLGEVGNQITLRIENDRISFLESNAEVAYFANRKLYVTDGEFLNSLKLGAFAFTPRSNGNLTFGKVN